MLADACPAAELARASLAVVLADARPAALRALASLAVVLADARLYVPISYIFRLSGTSGSSGN